MIAVIATRKGVVLNEVNPKLEGASGADGGGSDTTTGSAGEDTASGAAGDDTVTGASKDEDTRSEREKIMDAIEAKNLEKIDAEHIESGHAAPRPTPAPTPEPKKADDQVALQTGDEQVLEADQLSRVRVKVKIDGVEREVSGTDLVRDYQKAGAADKRLDEATRLLKEVRSLATTPPAGGPATPTPPAPPVGADGKKGGADSPPNSSTDAGVEKTGKQFLSALFEGDESKAWEHFQKILAGRPGGEQTQTSTTPTKEELLKYLTPAVMQRLAVESALDGFAKAHEDIVSDPHLAQLADGFLVEEQRTNPDKPFGEQLEAAAEKVQGWLKDKGVAPAPSPAPGSTTTRTEKLEAKRAADQVASAAARASAPVQQEQTASDVISEMRRSRGMDA